MWLINPPFHTTRYLIAPATTAELRQKAQRGVASQQTCWSAANSLHIFYHDVVLRQSDDNSPNMAKKGTSSQSQHPLLSHSLIKGPPFQPKRLTPATSQVSRDLGASSLDGHDGLLLPIRASPNIPANEYAEIRPRRAEEGSFPRAEAERKINQIGDKSRISNFAYGL
ncbi:hypothetical protein CHU98_g11311 [Xylaria longipes]|nr:hypothetical protein CHU98_g11311 [Xylaria longipes]